MALLLLVCLGGGHAHAQVSGSVALVSDYLYRGISLSQGDPVLQLNLNVDGPDGWYAGAFASRIKFDAARWGDVLLISYAGRAMRLDSGLAWDAGFSNYTYRGGSGRNYNEVHLGLGVENVRGRVSYSPDYLGNKARTVYADVSASHALGGGVSAFAHAGYLRALPGAPASMARSIVDGRIGLATSVSAWRLQLAWDGAHVARAGKPLYGYSRPSRHGVVVSATRSF